MRLLNGLLLLVVLIIVIVFACLNAEPVLFNYYLGSYTLPLSALLVAAFIIGLLIGAFFCSWKILKLKIQIRRLKRVEHVG